MDLVFEVLGWIGAAAILLGYFLFSIGRIQNGVKYQLINLIGAASLFTNALVNESWPFVILNAVWSATAVYALARLWLVSRASRRRSDGAKAI